MQFYWKNWFIYKKTKFIQLWYKRIFTILFTKKYPDVILTFLKIAFYILTIFFKIILINFYYKMISTILSYKKNFNPILLGKK